MDYLTNYYKNLSEQLQQRVNILQKQLDETNNSPQNPITDQEAFEKGVQAAQNSLIPNFREGVQGHPKFHHGYQLGMRHGLEALKMKDVSPETYGGYPTPSEMAQKFMATDGRTHVGSAQY